MRLLGTFVGTERDRVSADIVTRLRSVNPDSGIVRGVNNGASSVSAILVEVV